MHVDGRMLLCVLYRSHVMSAVTLLAAIIAGSAGEVRSEALNGAPRRPTLTFPHGTLTSLSTAVAWISDPHDACEVRIGFAAEPETADVWASGEIKTHDSRVRTPVLPASSTLCAFVRVGGPSGWSPWSDPQRFETPPSPVLRLLKPQHAGRVKGPEVTIEWEVECHEPVSLQQVTLDNAKPVDVAPQNRSISLPGLSEGLHGVKLTLTAGSKTVERESTFYVYIPVQQSSSKLYLLDLTALRGVDVSDRRAAADAFETLQAAAVLQGIVNRERARLYINYTNVDGFWLDKVREKGAYLEHTEIAKLNGLDEAIATFRDSIKGAVVWDPSLACTSNIASTICGVEDLLPFRYDESEDSLYTRFVRGGARLPTVHNLVGKFTGQGKIPDTDRESTGSPKCDAYLWAKELYIDSGKCNPRKMGYYCDAFWLKHPEDMSLDNVGLTNHDYVVAHRGFFCDLDVWADEAPRDEPMQRHGLDRETFLEILLSCHKAAKGKMIHIAGFTPWAIKYTTHGNAGGKHDAVPTEWEMSRLVSAYNGYMDADAIGHVGMANASVFSLCKLPDRLVQNAPPTRRDLEAKGYVAADGSIGRYNFVYHYLGDYDSAAWMYNRVPDIWRGTTRGRVPSGWAFNPNLIERLPVVFEWCYETRSPNDYFVAGDSGAGYVNPTQLLPPREPSGLPSGEEAWIEHNIPYYRLLNYSITAFLINGFCHELTDASNRMFARFSGDGIMTQLHWMPKNRKEDHLLDGMPVAGMKQDITAPVDVVVEAVLKHVRPNETRFLAFRSILVGSDWIKTVNDTVRSQRPDCRFEPVDPYTYFYLLKHSLGGRVERRATYTFDTMPESVEARERLSVTVGLRNDAWDTWQARGDSPTRLRVSIGERADSVEVDLPHDVAPGEGAVVSFEIRAPERPGSCLFRIDLVRAGIAFSDAGDMPWEKPVLVR